MPIRMKNGLFLQVYLGLILMVFHVIHSKIV